MPLSGEVLCVGEGTGRPCSPQLSSAAQGSYHHRKITTICFKLPGVGRAQPCFMPASAILGIQQGCPTGVCARSIAWVVDVPGQTRSAGQG